MSQWMTSRRHPAPGTAEPPMPSYPMPLYRSTLDHRRSQGRTPDAQYPSGYLGAHRGKRDELVDRLGRRSDHKDYDRGVHHGSRMDPEAYFWPSHFKPTDGVKAVAKGVKQRPKMEYEPVMQTASGKIGPGKPSNPQVVLPRVTPWSSGSPAK